tara:strand:+ start:1773 stop:2582 length:810 start_codon:yes stop_codon:yes gene_type:complete
MSFGVDLHGPDITFHRELQALMQSPDEAACRAVLIDCFRRRDVAGVVMLAAGSAADGTPALQGVWAQTIAELPENMPIQQILGSVSGGMPRWLKGWLVRRRTPFSLSGITRYMPYTSDMMLRRASPRGVRPLADIVWSPYKHRDQQYALGIGLFERATPQRMEAINSLALAYVVKWALYAASESSATRDDSAGVIDLTKRELDCLRWLIAGKTLQDTADILNMSYANVRYHLDKAKQRHGYATTRQLMVRAAVDYDLSPLDGMDSSLRN